MGRRRLLWVSSERSRSQQLIFLDETLRWSTLPPPPVHYPGPLVPVGGRLVATTSVMGEEAIAAFEPSSGEWTDVTVPSVPTETICPVLLAPFQDTVVWVDGCDGGTFVMNGTGWDRPPDVGPPAAGVVRVAWTPTTVFAVTISPADPPQG
jgi:hypothetical protein